MHTSFSCKLALLSFKNYAIFGLPLDQFFATFEHIWAIAFFEKYVLCLGFQEAFFPILRPFLTHFDVCK